jgi:hypothetical protein
MLQMRRPPQAVSLLEYGTKLVGVSRGHWGVDLFPEAGEAIASFHSGDVNFGGGVGGDPEESSKVAARRARTRVRRYCAANRLNRLATLTYRGSGCHEPVVMRRDLGGFFRRLRHRLGGDAFPYLWTAEWHKTGHGLHAHFAVGRYVPRTAIEEAWPHGFVHIKLLGDLPYAASSLDQARRAARYLSKYVGKAFAEHRPGLHRYEVAQGFAPRREGISGATSEEVVAWAVGRMGREPHFVQPSSAWHDYRGPSAVFLSWT